MILDRSNTNLPHPISRIPYQFGNMINDLHVPNQLPTNDFSNHIVSDLELTKSKDGNWLGGSKMITYGYSGIIDNNEQQDLPFIEDNSNSKKNNIKSISNDEKQFLKALNLDD